MSSKEVAVGTEKFTRERFSVLPEMRSRFCQTDASWLKSRSTAVNTDVDPYFGIWRRRRVRGTYPFVTATSHDSQTETIITRDADVQVRLCCDTDLLPLKQDTDPPTPVQKPAIKAESMTSISSAEIEESHEEPPEDVEEKTESEEESPQDIHPSDSSESEKEEVESVTVRVERPSRIDYDWDYFEKYRQRPRSTGRSPFPRSRSPFRNSISRDELQDLTQIEPLKKEPPPPVVAPIDRPKELIKEDQVPKTTPDQKREESPQLPEKMVPEKGQDVKSASSPNLSTAPQTKATPPEEEEKSVEPATVHSNQMINPWADLRTETKVIIEVVTSRKREVSKVTSMNEVDADGKMSRKTTVTTSKKVPVVSTQHYSLPRRTPGKTPEPIVTSPPSTKATASPVPRDAKMTTSMQSVAPSECSTRPTSVTEDTAIGSMRSTPDPSQILSPTYSEQDISSQPRQSRVNILDPYNLLGEGDLTDTKRGKGESRESVATSRRSGRKLSIAERYNSGAKSPPPPPIIWHETSNSTITNEMVTEPFKSDDGRIRKPKSVSICSEAIIDNSGRESQVHTKSSASRLFENCVKEPTITSETHLCDTPPLMQLPNPPSADHPQTTHPPITHRSASSTIDRKSRMSDPFHDPRMTESRGEKKSSMRGKSSTHSSMRSPEREILESSLDQMMPPEIKVQPEYQSPPDPIITSPLSTLDKRARREKIKRSAKDGRLFSDVDLASFPKPQEESQELERQQQTTQVKRPDTSDKFSTPETRPQDPVSGYHPVKRSTSAIPQTRAKTATPHQHQPPAPIQDLATFYPPLFTGAKVSEILRKSGETKIPVAKAPGTELVTRLTKTTHPESEKGKTGKSKMVLEQNLKSGDGVYDTKGCRMINRITVDNPPVAKKKPGFLTRILRKDGSYKKRSQSLGDLDKAAEELNGKDPQVGGEGLMATKTKFERLKAPPGSGRDDTTWEYSLECNCVNGLNTSVRFVPLLLTQCCMMTDVVSWLT